ncbi:MAG: hypothetical protein KJ011_18240, partial [Burkholderiaceae bacterium]|nr:hypothetical protein [Burkholderiaceae bacterium]
IRYCNSSFWADKSVMALVLCCRSVGDESGFAPAPADPWRVRCQYRAAPGPMRDAETSDGN